VLVVTYDELLQSRRRLGRVDAAAAEALPSYGDGGVDAEEDEEGSLAQDVENLLTPDGGGDEVQLPVFGGVVEQSSDGLEALCMCFAAIGGGGTRETGIRGRLFY